MTHKLLTHPQRYQHRTHLRSLMGFYVLINTLLLLLLSFIKYSLPLKLEMIYKFSLSLNILYLLNFPFNAEEAIVLFTRNQKECVSDNSANFAFIN